MMIRGFFTTFLMKHKRGSLGFGNAAFGSGREGVLLITTNFDLTNASYASSVTWPNRKGPIKKHFLAGPIIFLYSGHKTKMSLVKQKKRMTTF